MSHVMFVLICCIWGCSFILMKRAQASFGFIGVGAWRVVFGAAALFVAWKLMRRPWPLKKRDSLPVFAIAVIGYAIPFCVQPYVVREVQAAASHGGAFGGMMVSFVPLATVLASIVILRVYPSVRQIIGVLGGIGFIYLLYADELNHGVTLRLLLLGAVTPVCYGFANTYLKRRFHHVSPIVMAMVAMATTACLLAPLSIVKEDIQRNDALMMSIVYLALLGVICTGFAGAMFYKLIQGHGPLYAGMVTYIIPCVAMLVGWLDGEKFEGSQIFAMAGIFATVALVQWPGRQPKPAMEAETD